MSNRMSQDSLAPIDVKGTMSRLCLGAEDAQRLIKMVVDELPDYVEKIGESRHDVNELRKCIHKLLGSTSYCQLPHVDSVARRVQMHYIKGQEPGQDLDQAIDDLFNRIEEVQSYYAKMVFEESSELV